MTDTVDTPAMDRPLAWKVLAGVLLLIAIGLAAFFLFEDREAWQETLENWLKTARGTPWALPLVCLTYIIGGAVFFPVMVLNLACAVVFGLWGILYALIGAISSAAVMFGVGRFLHKRYGDKFMSNTAIKKIDKALKNTGLMGVVVFHSVPVPPYTVVNLGAGMTSINFKVYMIGTLIALLPGAIARGVVGDSITRLLLNPDLKTSVYLGCGLLLWITLIVGSHMALRRWQNLAHKKTAP